MRRSSAPQAPHNQGAAAGCGRRAVHGAQGKRYGRGRLRTKGIEPRIERLDLAWPPARGKDWNAPHHRMSSTMALTAGEAPEVDRMVRVANHSDRVSCR